MLKDNENLFTSSRVANALDVSVKTLSSWYKWYQDDSIEKPKNFPQLPEYLQEHKNAPRYWTKDGVKQLKKFKKWVPKGRNGVMGAINNQYLNKHKEKTNND